MVEKTRESGEAAAGLFEIPSLPDATTRIEQAAHRQISMLQAEGVLDANDDLLVALIFDLARLVGRASVKGASAGGAMVAKQLLEALDKLPRALQGEQRSEFDSLIDLMQDAADSD